MGKSRMLRKRSLGERLLKDLQKNWIYYVMILPVILYFIIFHYWPMYGVQIAFKDFKLRAGVMGSDWVGMKHFTKFIGSYNFKTLCLNTLGISVYTLCVGFPIPIIFALFLNYLKSQRLKKAVQMVSYAPHFISTVVICSMIMMFTDLDSGIFNIILRVLGREPVNFLAKADWFKSIYVWTGVWQGMGWSAIIYVSALSGVDYQMHEAAIMDGATKIQRMLHVDLPSIKPTIIMLLILDIGSLMNVGFEKVYLLQNSLNRPKSMIISTYVYEVGLVNTEYSYAAAIGLFNNVINAILLVAANTISKKLADESLF